MKENSKQVFESFGNVCNICGIEAYYPEHYTDLCPKCNRVIHVNHIYGCKCEESIYVGNSKVINKVKALIEYDKKMEEMKNVK